ncbi:MAG TPA: hypothetical protein VGQ42_15835 [Candidatus Dormibacteraeota bacterium]|jgi:hypothetical protein|nr:hypothetical protein [Candidatus Dormibacteraeota bacterium]
MDQQHGGMRDALQGVRRTFEQRPVLWSVALATSAGAAVLIWFAMNGLDATVRLPIIVIAAALNLLIAAGYATDISPDED